MIALNTYSFAIRMGLLGNKKKIWKFKDFLRFCKKKKFEKLNFLLIISQKKKIKNLNIFLNY